MKLETLKTRVGNADYEVDSEAVADAIVRRVLATREQFAHAVESMNGTGPRAGGGALGSS